MQPEHVNDDSRRTPGVYDSNTGKLRTDAQAVEAFRRYARGNRGAQLGVKVVDGEAGQRAGEIFARHDRVQTENMRRNLAICRTCSLYDSVAAFCRRVRASRPAECTDPDGRSQEITTELQRINRCPIGRFGEKA